MKVRIDKQLKKQKTTLCKSAFIAALWMASCGTAVADDWKVNLQDADIRAFINEVASITGKNFSIDPRVNGNVTVISNQPMDEDEIYQLFLSVLEVNGVAAVQRGNITILEPDNIAKQSGLPVDLNSEADGQQMVTRVIYLNNTQPSEILSVIRPLMPSSAHAAVVNSVGALVLSDKANSLNELELLISSLDSGMDNTLEIIPLEHTDADRMMELLSELATDSKDPKASAGGSQLKIIADSSSDRLLITGNPQKIITIKSMVNRLDTLPAKRFSGMKVFRLNYSEASHIANILRALITNQSINSAESNASISTASLNNASSSNKKNKSNSAISPAPSSNKGGASGSTDSSGHKFSIIADETRNALYVNASSQTMTQVESFIEEIDVQDVQVLIQAAVLEVSGDDMEQLGVQWALGNNSLGHGLVNFNNVGTSATTLAASVLSKNPVAISSAAGSIAGALLGIGNSKKSSDGTTNFYGAILQAIDKSSNANLLSTPSITTINHKEASLLVGQNVPFVTGSFSNAGGSNSSPFQTVDRQDVGIQLNVIPHVGPDGVVKLVVSQEVSSVVEGSASNTSGLITNKSFIDTTVMAKSGQTIALGGLMREKTSQNQQKVPTIGDVPFLGRLFRSDSTSTQKSNLIIFLQPTVLKNGGIIPSITERDGDRMKVMQLNIEPNGTIRQIPLTGNNGWYGEGIKFSDNSSIMPTRGPNVSDSLVQSGFSRVNYPVTNQGNATYIDKSTLAITNTAQNNAVPTVNSIDSTTDTVPLMKADVSTNSTDIDTNITDADDSSIEPNNTPLNIEPNNNLNIHNFDFE